MSNTGRLDLLHPPSTPTHQPRPVPVDCYDGTDSQRHEIADTDGQQQSDLRTDSRDLHPLEPPPEIHPDCFAPTLPSPHHELLQPPEAALCPSLDPSVSTVTSFTATVRPQGKITYRKAWNCLEQQVRRTVDARANEFDKPESPPDPRRSSIETDSRHADGNDLEALKSLQIDVPFQSTSTVRQLSLRLQSYGNHFSSISRPRAPSIEGPSVYCPERPVPIQPGSRNARGKPEEQDCQES